MFVYGLQAVHLAQHFSGPVFVHLQNVSANVKIRGFIAHLDVDLVYHNNTDLPLEVTYVCPVDAKSAIYSFQAKLEGRTIIAHCLEKEKAKKIYKEAVRQGKTAILGHEDQTSGDLFHLNLGNFPKGETARLSLKMVMELPVAVDGAINFTLPTIFNPRYCPADQQPGPERNSPVSGCLVIPSRTQYSLDIKGEIRGSHKIAKVVSDSDPINVTICDEETTAVISQIGETKLDHDWSFNVFYRTVHKPQVLQMAGDPTGTGMMKKDMLMMNLFPEVPLEGFSPHNELIFVIDRSGSMQGSNIDNAKKTLLLFLKSLPLGCRFNIVSFGSHFTTLFKSSSERYTERTLKTALDLQKSMDADMGGTEVLEALKYVYSQDFIPGYARQMILLTDGAVWNLHQIFELISRYASKTRVFAVGIGDGASTALVQGIAQAGGGRYEMVTSGAELQTKVMGLVASMLQDNVSDVTVEFVVEPPQTVSLIPTIPPIIFGGQHLIVYAPLQPKSIIKSVTLKGKIREFNISSTIDENECKVVHDSNFTFHRLAAKVQLRKWELNETGITSDVISLSVSASVACKATAFVGIDEDGKTIKDEFYHAEVAEVPQGYMFCPPQNVGPCFTTFGTSRRSKVGAVGAPFISLPGGSKPKSCESKSKSGFSFGGFGLFGSANRSYGLAPQQKQQSNAIYRPGSVIEKQEVKDTFQLIVSEQNFDGSWDLQQFGHFTDLSSDQIKEILRVLCIEDERCGATVLTLALLEVKFMARKQEWLLLHIKGKMFLQSKGVDTIPVIEKCSQLLQNK